MNDFTIFLLFIILMGALIFIKGMTALPVVVAVMVFGGLYLYLRGKYYLMETYTGKEPVEVLVEPVNPPYSTRPIMSLDDYDDLEYDVVEANRAEISRATKTARINENHFSTDKLPPDSQIRVQARELRPEPAPASAKSLETFVNIEAAAFQPPDMDAKEASEKQMLAMYSPQKTADLTKYSIDDPEELIKAIYKKKKQVPSYRKRDDGAYEVYEVQDEDPKIVWEDEAAGGPARVSAVGDYIAVPAIAKQTAANLDPFYDTAFTPGLERMFAPTSPRLNWY